MTAPPASGATSNVLRYGTVKVAGHSPALINDVECRKRGPVFKVASPEGSGGDLACLSPGFASAIDGSGDDVATMVPPSRSGSARTGMLGARAPPSDAA